MTQLLLGAPFGHPRGVAIRLDLEPGRVLVPDAIRGALLRFGCYPPAIPKILACLASADRYDCRLQATWFNRQRQEVIEHLRPLGVRLTIVEEEQRLC